MKTLDDFNFKGKRVLLRVDLNSPVIGKKVIDNPRFKEHSKTIKELLRKKAVVVILAHQSRPGKKDFTSLKQHAAILNKYVKVRFVDDVIGKKAMMEIQKLKGGEALLLDNVRRLKSEYTPGNNKIVKAFKGKFDYYINDAFSICHRSQTTIVTLPKHFPSGVGRVFENELKNLDILKSKLKGSVFVLGGVKANDVIHLVKKSKVITTGTLALLALKARGYKLGKMDSILKGNESIIKNIKLYLRGTKTPIDLAIEYRRKRKEIDLNDLPVDSLILDIGSKTINDYEKEIIKAKAIFFKGAAGYVEDAKFDNGTKALLKAVARAKGFSIVSGGSSSSMIRKFRMKRSDFDYVSLSGGSLVYYLAGKKLPGLEVLR